MKRGIIPQFDWSRIVTNHDHDQDHGKNILKSKNKVKFGFVCENLHGLSKIKQVKDQLTQRLQSCKLILQVEY